MYYLFNPWTRHSTFFIDAEIFTDRPPSYEYMNELKVELEKVSYICVVLWSTEWQFDCLWWPGPWESTGGYKSSCTWTWREGHLVQDVMILVQWLWTLRATEDTGFWVLTVWEFHTQLKIESSFTTLHHLMKIWVVIGYPVLDCYAECSASLNSALLYHIRCWRFVLLLIAVSMGMLYNNAWLNLALLYHFSCWRFGFLLASISLRVLFTLCDLIQHYCSAAAVEDLGFYWLWLGALYAFHDWFQNDYI